MLLFLEEKLVDTFASSFCQLKLLAAVLSCVWNGICVFSLFFKKLARKDKQIGFTFLLLVAGANFY